MHACILGYCSSHEAEEEVSAMQCNSCGRDIPPNQTPARRAKSENTITADRARRARVLVPPPPLWASCGGGDLDVRVTVWALTPFPNGWPWDPSSAMGIRPGDTHGELLILSRACEELWAPTIQSLSLRKEAISFHAVGHHAG